MGTVLNDRVIDWVTAPGDQYTKLPCPPPPCSASIYLSAMWISTTGTIKVEEIAPPGLDPDMISTDEKDRIQQWAFQAVTQELGCALMEAEKQLSTESAPVKLKATDFTLSDAAFRIMSATFKVRADRVISRSTQTPSA